MSQFERNVQAVDAEVHLAFACPEGAIAQVSLKNKFLKYNVDSWDEFKMLERVPRLVGKFREAVNKLIYKCNKFLKYNVDSWDEFKMLERVPRLVGKFREAVNKLIGRADSIEEKE